MFKNEFIFRGAAEAIKNLIAVPKNHKIIVMDQWIDDCPASTVKLTYSSSQHGQRVIIIISIVNGEIDIIYNDRQVKAFHHVQLDLADPNCWETLLSWMKKWRLTPESTVLTGELL